MPHKSTGDTEPCEQLITQEEYELARQAREKRQRRNKKGYERSEKVSLQGRPEGPFSYYAPEVPKSSHGANSLLKYLELLVAEPRRVIMGFAVFFLTLDALSGRGWLPIPGLSPHASAESVTEVRSDQLVEQIESTVREHCLANTAKSKTYYWNKLRELSGKYARATKEPARVPICKDLGVPEILPNEP